MAWMASKTDTDFRSMAMRGVLSRTEIATECGFAKSALSQNPRIREALKRLEDDLRERGVESTRASSLSNAGPKPFTARTFPVSGSTSTGLRKRKAVAR